MSDHAIRDAVDAGLLACASHCLDSQEERDAVATEVVRRVLDVVGEQREGLCGICGYGGPFDIFVLPRPHRDPNRMWVIEDCGGCDATRLAEHERVRDEDGAAAGDARVIAATPWRAG